VISLGGFLSVCPKEDIHLIYNLHCFLLYAFGGSS
jgi:hypothetical protein